MHGSAAYESRVSVPEESMSLQRLPTEEHEQNARAKGFTSIVGIDEVGRGALAGPVVAAAVQLPQNCGIERIRDSKVVPEAEREELYEQICSDAIAWGVGVVDNREIDSINILQATFVAMKAAVASLPETPDFALVDGRDMPDVGVVGQALIKGDGRSLSIAAASIVAKVTRDRIMRQEHQRFPAYGFLSNKGYGTVVHRAAIQEHGPCSIHRLSFLGSILQQRLFVS